MGLPKHGIGTDVPRHLRSGLTNQGPSSYTLTHKGLLARPAVEETLVTLVTLVTTARVSRNRTSRKSPRPSPRKARRVTKVTNSLNDNYSIAATVAPFVKDIIKDVQCVSFVVPSSPAPFVSGADDVAANGLVGAILQQFWKVWANLGACPRVVQILREGYTLPFVQRPKVT